MRRLAWYELLALALAAWVTLWTGVRIFAAYEQRRVVDRICPEPMRCPPCGEVRR